MGIVIQAGGDEDCPAEHVHAGAQGKGDYEVNQKCKELVQQHPDEILSAGQVDSIPFCHAQASLRFVPLQRLLRPSGKTPALHFDANTLAPPEIIPPDGAQYILHAARGVRKSFSCPGGTVPAAWKKGIAPP